MKVTKEMRLRRAMGYLEEDAAREKSEIQKLENIHLQEIIILRNKKQMYIAEIEQMIRNIRAEIREEQMVRKVEKAEGKGTWA